MWRMFIWQIRELVWTREINIGKDVGCPFDVSSTFPLVAMLDC